MSSMIIVLEAIQTPKWKVYTKVQTQVTFILHFQHDFFRKLNVCLRFYILQSILENCYLPSILEIVKQTIKCIL